jgi:hypothetical protein
VLTASQPLAKALLTPFTKIPQSVFSAAVWFLVVADVPGALMVEVGGGVVLPGDIALPVVVDPLLTLLGTEEDV